LAAQPGARLAGRAHPARPRGSHGTSIGRIGKFAWNDPCEAGGLGSKADPCEVGGLGSKADPCEVGGLGSKADPCEAGGLGSKATRERPAAERPDPRAPA
jgi:hypothetical protein